MYNLNRKTLCVPFLSYGSSPYYLYTHITEPIIRDSVKRSLPLAFSFYDYDCYQPNNDGISETDTREKLLNLQFVIENNHIEPTYLPIACNDNQALSYKKEPTLYHITTIW